MKIATWGGGKVQTICNYEVTKTRYQNKRI